MSADYTLGQPVMFTAYLTRTSERNTVGRGIRRAWEETPTSTALGNPRPGIIVGKRTLANGIRVWEGDDEGYVFLPGEHFTAYLVAYAMHRKPVLVPPEHLEPDDGTPPPAPEPAQFPGQTAIDL